MKTETFFERFDHFAGAPNAVPRLRELLLHLAVTGRLVDQDALDESGEELLKRVNAERLAALKAGRIGAMKPLPPPDEEELAFTIPRGWEAARLIDLVMEIQTAQLDLVHLVVRLPILIEPP